MCLRVSEKGNEIERYLAVPIEDTNDPLVWWADHRALYPRLSHMALDYLSIPGKFVLSSAFDPCTNLSLLATSVNVERVFSKGRLLLSHVCSRMKAQTTCAVLCVRAWSRTGYIKAADLHKAALMADIDNDEHRFQLVPGWDRIDVDRVDPS